MSFKGELEPKGLPITSNVKIDNREWVYIPINNFATTPDNHLFHMLNDCQLMHDKLQLMVVHDNRHAHISNASYL